MKIGVFPGSFDPITLGHIAVIKKAENLFDKIIVALGSNSSKQYFFSVEQRMAQLKEAFADMDNVEVQQYEGLTIDFCNKVGAKYLIRGLRDGKDFEYEKSIAIMNAEMKTGVETIFFMTDAKYSAINSFIVRDILKNGGDASPFLPDAVLKTI